LLSHDISTFIPSPLFEFSFKVPLLMNEHLHYANSFKDLIECYNHTSIFNSKLLMNCPTPQNVMKGQ
jgi:hypothetical protein